MAIISGHHQNGRPIHSFSNYGLKSVSNNSSSETQGNAFFARELINKLPEQFDQGFMITHGQQPSLMPIHEVGG